MDLPSQDLAEELVRRFGHMASRDGGELTVIGADEESIQLRYRPGIDPDCEEGACVLPGSELRTMLTEAVERQQADLRVELEVA